MRLVVRFLVPNSHNVAFSEQHWYWWTGHTLEGEAWLLRRWSVSGCPRVSILVCRLWSVPRCLPTLHPSNYDSNAHRQSVSLFEHDVCSLSTPSSCLLVLTAFFTSTRNPSILIRHRYHSSCSVNPILWFFSFISLSLRKCVSFSFSYCSTLLVDQSKNRIISLSESEITLSTNFFYRLSFSWINGINTGVCPAKCIILIPFSSLFNLPWLASSLGHRRRHSMHSFVR